MSQRELGFNAHFQRCVLSRIFKDRAFSLQAIRYLNEDCFDTTSLRWIYSRVVNEEITSLEILVSRLAESIRLKKINSELKDAVIEEIKTISNIDERNDAAYGIKIIKEFAHFTLLKKGLLDAAQNLKKGAKAGEVHHNIIKVLSKAGPLSEETRSTNVITNFKERQEERRKRVEAGDIVFIPTGIQELDTTIGGPSPGQFWAWFGDTNIGKSALAMMISKSAMIAGFPTWHISLEDIDDMTLQRFDTSFTMVPYQKFTYLNFDEKDKEKINKIFQLLETARKDYLWLTKMEETATMSMIESEYERLRLVHNFHPRCVILDTPYCMEPSHKKENIRVSNKYIYQELRRFCRREKVALHAFDQSRQESQGKVMGTRAASESYAKSQIPDGFITLNQTKIQKKEGIIELYVAKQKDRDKNISFIVRPRMHIMQFESVIRG